VVADCISIRGSFVGNREDLAEALSFAAEGKVKADIELQPLSAINQVFTRLGHGDVQARSFPYEILWEERELKSVANLTRQDGRDFLRLALQIGLKVNTTRYPLSQANLALADLRAGRFEGAAVLVP
jgi:D-arabinose 1-dehydrogenase-like Zn-dependent alcohol dehydrogenase